MEPVDKRIVLQHTQGSTKGLMQIVGTMSQLGVADPAALSAFLPHVQFIDRVNACSLLTVKPRYVLYREVWGPAPTLDPRQR